MTEDLEKVIVRMSPSMHVALKQRAVVERRSMAEVMREAVRQYLKRDPS